jgi:hypothetical protein
VELSLFQDTGRGLATKKEVSMGELLLSVPLNHIITPDVCIKILRNTSVVEWTDQKLISAFLLLHRLNLIDGSKWQSYVLNHIPTSFSLPFYSLNTTQLSELSLHFRQEIEYQRLRFTETYKFMRKYFRSVYHKTPSVDDVLWAFSAVNTRVLTLKDKKGTVICRQALVPFFDMFNHDISASNCEIIVEDGELRVHAGANYGNGDQAFICYGHHDNEFLWREYGFISNDFTFDFYSFDIYFTDTPYQDLVVTNDGISWKMMNACRFLVASSPSSKSEKLFQELEDIELGKLEQFSDQEAENGVIEVCFAMIEKELQHLKNIHETHEFSKKINLFHIQLLSKFKVLK